MRIDPLNAAAVPPGSRQVLVTFEPGARTAWHTHPLGQRLIVTAGSGWAQCAGESTREIRAGDVVGCPPGEKHWHGATATTGDEPYRDPGSARRQKRRVAGKGRGRGISGRAVAISCRAGIPTRIGMETAMAWPRLWDLAKLQLLHLTTTGRRTGLPREIEIWFVVCGERFYLFAETGEAVGWSNIRRNPKVTVRISGRQIGAAARCSTVTPIAAVGPSRCRRGSQIWVGRGAAGGNHPAAETDGPGLNDVRRTRPPAACSSSRAAERIKKQLRYLPCMIASRTCQANDTVAQVVGFSAALGTRSAPKRAVASSR